MTAAPFDTGREPQLAAAHRATMRAVVQTAYGSRPEDVLRLGEVERPPCGTGDVLVRVHSASVDRGTWHIMAGLPYPIRLAGFGVRRPKHLNPGRSLAGTVATVGADVASFTPGQQVFGVADGTFAEYAVARPNKLAVKPAGLSFDEAAAMPISGLTALQAVRDRAVIRAGEQVLIIGAAGGVGTFAVQLAKALGADVTGVCSTGKVDLVTDLGADRVLDYTVDDFATGGSRYDVILDTGGNTELARLRGALTPTGRLVIVGGETDGRLLGGSSRQLRAQLVSPFTRQKLGTFIASENAADLATLARFADTGALRSAVERVFTLGETGAAVRHLLDGRARGKLVISVKGDDGPVP